MATLRNRFFLEGVLLGSACGVLLGSLIAFQVNGARLNTARRFIVRVARRQQPEIDFALIRQ